MALVGRIDRDARYDHLPIKTVYNKGARLGHLLPSTVIHGMDGESPSGVTCVSIFHSTDPALHPIPLR